MMEKSKIFNGNKLKPVEKKERIADKIENMWKSENKAKKQYKKMVLKLETSGEERRKIEIKLESESSAIHTNNYSLISELLKEFFNCDSD